MIHIAPFLIKNRQWIAESCYLGGFCPTVARKGRKPMRETELACADFFNLHKKFRPMFWFPETKSWSSKDNDNLVSK